MNQTSTTKLYGGIECEHCKYEDNGCGYYLVTCKEHDGNYRECGCRVGHMECDRHAWLSLPIMKSKMTLNKLEGFEVDR